MTPEELRNDEVARFVLERLGGRSRVLEVGCGRGEVARALAASGLAVTALDASLRDLVEAPAVRFVERDFLEYEDAPFEAVIFTVSLHHISPLERAIDRAVALLRPEGLLIADELDLDAPDAATLRWYYDTQEKLAAAGHYAAHRIDHDHGHGHAGGDVVERWHHAHHHDEPLHTGAAMERAIAARLEMVELQRLEYLYRYIGRGLAEDDTGAWIATQVRAAERRGIAEGSLRAVGLRIVARRRAPAPHAAR